ncbi:hypothetical protein MHB54_01240 [Paenibacillus sp. FSL M7-0802]|uniref:hypothetical protein n=1 Tax=Paenibacillus sp. FSL M7-0802 TaxID=2921536 RepID=UPI0030F6378D
MTIILRKEAKNYPKNNISYTYTTGISDKSLYNNEITFESVLEKFGIGSNCTILISKMRFFLNTVEQLYEFIERLPLETADLPEQSLLTKMRKERIDTCSYIDVSSFLCDFYRNKRLALEKLFQEPINQFKMNKLVSKDPSEIYNARQEKGKYCTMLEVSLLLM